MHRLLVLLALVACSAEVEEPAHTEAGPAPAAEAPAPAAPPAPAAAAEPWARRTVPDGPEHDQARRGLELARDTHRLLPDHVPSSGLNCVNCHLEDAQRPKAAPWVGVADRYPRYRARSGKVDDLQDRINGCMERSMNGKALERDSEPMLAFVAYMEFLGEGIEDGKALPDTGMPKLSKDIVPDPKHGEELFKAKCAACHQAEGQGVYGPEDVTMFPALWGERSFNIGAGMARQDTAASFVRWNMPQGQGGTLTEQEAYDLASFFIFQDRPDLAKKDQDWPKDPKPRDARY
jgi:thiosulfate dehydrogenase